MAEDEASLREMFEQMFLSGSDTEKKQLNDSILQVMPTLFYPSLHALIFKIRF